MWPALPNSDKPHAPIDFHGVVKYYGDKAVLRNLDLMIEQGTTLGLVGTNGAGKTTLIKCLLDFCHLDDGRISIFGRQHSKIDARAPLVYLPEQFQAPGFHTGEQFLKFFIKLHGGCYDRQKVVDLFDRLGLEQNALDQTIRSYSKGMSQKLGLALCLLANKPLLVLDEPMSGLDPKARVLFKQAMMEYKQKGGSIFFSTHLLSDVESLCDTIAVLDGGELRFVGSPAECCRDYGTDNLESAYMNCIDKRTTADCSGYCPKIGQ